MSETGNIFNIYISYEPSRNLNITEVGDYMRKNFGTDSRSCLSPDSGFFIYDKIFDDFLDNDTTTERLEKFVSAIRIKEKIVEFSMKFPMNVNCLVYYMSRSINYNFDTRNVGEYEFNVQFKLVGNVKDELICAMKSYCPNIDVVSNDINLMVGLKFYATIHDATKPGTSNPVSDIIKIIRKNGSCGTIYVLCGTFSKFIEVPKI